MKKIIISTVAAMAVLSTSALAEIKDLEFHGQAKVIYQTTDRTHSDPAKETAETGLFERGVWKATGAGTGAAFGGAAAGGASVLLGVSAVVGNGYKVTYELQGVSTLGLEGNVVATSMWGGDLESYNTSQAHITKKIANTTVKIGRQELNTPLLFTEKWNVAKNTFDAGVLINSDIPNVTLIAALVGKHNSGGAKFATNYGGSARTAIMDIDGKSPYVKLGVNGATAFGAIVTPMDNLKLQAWYYAVKQHSTAIWVQADMKKIADILNVGVQYSQFDPDSEFLPGAKNSSILAAKVSGNVVGANVFAAYSKADKDGTLGFANIATSDKTKIYTGTGSIYMDGVVTAPGAKTYKVGASTKLAGVKLAASYSKADDVLTSGDDISAWDVKASGKVAGLNLTAIYTQMDNDTVTFGGHEMDTLRFVAVLPF